MFAAFLCGETQIVPEIYGISIFFIFFMKFGQEKSLKNFIHYISMNDCSSKRVKLAKYTRFFDLKKRGQHDLQYVLGDLCTPLIVEFFSEHTV